MTISHKTLGLSALVLLAGAAGLWLSTRPDGREEGPRVATEPFSLQSPVQTSMEAPVDIAIESSGNGTARVTLHFHRPATDVSVLAYGVEGARVLGEGRPISGLSVKAGDVETFQSGFVPSAEGGGFLAVYVEALFDGRLHMGRAASVRLEPVGRAADASPSASTEPAGKIVVDSEGRRVHVMPAGR